MRHILIEKDTALTLVTTPVRLHIVLRMTSGEEFMAWQSAPPYLRLGDLGIPGPRASYKVLKQAVILGDRARIWEEGEATTVELTVVKTCEQETVLNYFPTNPG